MNRFLYMRVHDFKKSLSNHCMLSCVVSVNYKEIHYKQNLYPLPKRYIWNDKATLLF